MAQNSIDHLEQLLSSLDVLAEREGMLVKDKLWAQAEEVQQRMLSLVEAITPLAQDLKHRGILPQRLNTKIAAIIARQHRTFDERGTLLKQIGDELTETKAAGAKINTLRPVYGKKIIPSDGTSSSTLDARG